MRSTMKTFIVLISALGVLAACASRNHPSGVDTVEQAKARNLPIFITELKTTRPYQDGKVDVSIAFINTAPKTIRSVRFTLVARDATWASLRSETTNRFEATLEDSRQIEPGGKGGNRWREVWQNRRIVCSEIMETDVEFTDGTVAVTYADPGRRACR